MVGARMLKTPLRSYNVPIGCPISRRAVQFELAGLQKTVIIKTRAKRLPV